MKTINLNIHHIDETKAYLGDGVYASNDGFHVVLSTADNIIYLDEFCLIGLETYLQKLKEKNYEKN